MRNVDGRQTRPANDVGRPDGGAERAPVDGGWSEQTHADWETLTLCARAWSTTAPEGSRKRERAEAEALIARLEAAFGKRKRRREAPHGQTPPDAEA